MNFQLTESDHQTIEAIAKRWANVSKVWGLMGRLDKGFPDTMTTMMDLTATHANGCPLDLVGLLESDDFDLVHDIGGINAYLDRATGSLINCFLPRYSIRRRS